MRQATLLVNALIARTLLHGIVKSKAPHLLPIDPVSAPFLTIYTVRKFLPIVLNSRVRKNYQSTGSFSVRRRSSELSTQLFMKKFISPY